MELACDLPPGFGAGVYRGLLHPGSCCKEVDSQARVSMGEAAAFVFALAILTMVVDAKPLVVVGLISLYIRSYDLGAAFPHPCSRLLAGVLVSIFVVVRPDDLVSTRVGILDAMTRTALMKLGYAVSGSGLIIFSPDPTFVIVELVLILFRGGFCSLRLCNRRSRSTAARFQAVDLGWLIGLLLATTCLNVSVLRRWPSREGWLFRHRG